MRAFAEAGVDLVDVSTGQTVRDAQPVYGRMFQTPFSEQVRNEARVATMCVGNITTADQVNTILAAGRAERNRRTAGPADRAVGAQPRRLLWHLL